MTEPLDPVDPLAEAAPPSPVATDAPSPVPVVEPGQVATDAPSPVPAVEPGHVPAVEPGRASAAVNEPVTGVSGRRRPRRRTIILGVVGVLVVALVGGLAWYFQALPLMPEATAALASTAGAAFTEQPTGLTYSPTGAPPTTGLILYPGARVQAAGYAPGARAIAEEGYLVVVVPMPLNFAIFGVNAADGVISAHPEIEHWAIGGHSLGGAMAAQYAADHPDAVAGLALCGAYSAADLSSSGLVVSSVYGSLDAGLPKIEDSATRAMLPATTAYDRIEGGNHEQCGWYTGQPNDPPATVTRVDQQIRMVTAWLGVLDQISTAP